MLLIDLCRFSASAVLYSTLHSFRLFLQSTPALPAFLAFSQQLEPFFPVYNPVALSPQSKISIFHNFPKSSAIHLFHPSECKRTFILIALGFAYEGMDQAKQQVFINEKRNPNSMLT